ncbi:hypothetical protein ACFXD5_03735 [Streptomyces sp. NPDC059385]|uniref:hypothetical protein n=1 Tax=Streptomyces sp. NPDC059385 TaxID=3346817 RepID=UPI00367417E0
MTMRDPKRLKLKAVLLAAAVGLGALTTAACGKNGGDAGSAAPSLASQPASSSPAVPSPAASATPSPAAPATSSPAVTRRPGTPAATPKGDKPQVALTEDPTAAGNELARLRKAGWFNPNKIEYADDPVIALQQFKRWLDLGYIAGDGAWTTEGLAAVKRANESGTPL